MALNVNKTLNSRFFKINLKSKLLSRFAVSDLVVFRVVCQEVSFSRDFHDSFLYVPDFYFTHFSRPERKLINDHLV